jgi:alpha-beta hydrolase superfamily lysophospholipase
MEEKRNKAAIVQVEALTETFVKETRKFKRTSQRNVGLGLDVLTWNLKTCGTSAAQQWQTCEYFTLIIQDTERILGKSC